MLKSAARKLASLQSRAWLPPTLLLLALSSAFIFGAERRDYFYRGHLHNELSAKNMAIAENLSSEHNFLMFTRKTLDADGRTVYEPYNRFPIGSHALTKLAILPFGDDLSAKIYAARTLMLAFFAAAAVLAYLSLYRIAASRWIALTAALLAFASPYCLYYADAITSEAVVDIFGVLLVFHGMVIFEQEGRFRQFLLKTCVALLLGWHVYALLLPFIVLGLTRELVKASSAASASPNAARSLRLAALSLTRSRYLTLGAAALLFGVSVLTFNFANEYFALNREIPPTKLYSFRSMMFRIGVGDARDPEFVYYANQLHWPNFVERQLHRVGAMALPYAFSPSFVDRDLNLLLPFVIYGTAAFGACMIGLLFVRRHKILLAALALSGFCWTLPIRHNTAILSHTYEALLYVGIALTLFSLLLSLCRRMAGERLVAALSIAALLIFVASALRMSQLTASDQQADEIHKTTISDFEAIRSIANHGDLVQTDAIPRAYKRIRTFNYYLSGRIQMSANRPTTPDRAPDFVVTDMLLDGLAPLTPQNQMIFLYEWDAYHRHIDEIIAQTDAPIIRSDFDVHHIRNALIYAKDACGEDDLSETFFLALFPADESDLPPERKPHGFDNRDFRFADQAIRRGARCIAITPLPDYGIARIHTGQFVQRADGSFEHIWEGDARLTDTAH